MPDAPSCRFCGAALTRTFVDLGVMPLANSYIKKADLEAGREHPLPLHTRVCEECLLVQADDPMDAAEIFDDSYAYYSSYSDSWVEHARRYAVAMIDRLGLGPDSLVVEIASNDGYLLQHFVARGVPALGVEPAENCAREAKTRGVESEVAFFNEATAKRLAERGLKADLMLGNNVLAHVPNIRDFLAGFPIMLKPEGTLTFEFPHLLNLMDQVQFDTIYHEHFSYLSLLIVEKALASVGMRAYDVEELPTHGGSLRVFCCHKDAAFAEQPGLLHVRAKETEAGLHEIAAYEGFSEKVDATRRSFRAFLEKAAADGKTIAGYGAAAKGNTFLNVCGVGADDIVCVFDRNPHKQDRLLPGSHIPVLDPSALDEVKPDYLLILPWNLKDEVMTSFSRISQWGGRFVTAVPETRIF
ncbi:methyltransferase domain-containing protein [Chenggangzhangella methanolivorans]|uniref:methyltransferase domain-containing protein n=1 Tax=Chenggangzhangella methanolivorans TaxID=1437009 RepID=UPI003609968F